ncbi:MAG: hypothetical protein AAB520_02670 [Patescibacteria group bacterium]
MALFTKEGFDKLKADLKTAEEKRPEVVSTLAKARAMGDLSENGFYKSARFELNDLDRKIRQLRHLVQEGQVIQKPMSNETVQIGHTVVLKRLG